MSEDDTSFSEEDAAAVGFKVIEMAEKVRLGDQLGLGARAKWAFHIDDVRYAVTVEVAVPAEPV